MCFETCEATRSNFGVSPLANTTTIVEAIQMTSKTTCAKFGIALLADSTPMIEAVQIAGEAGCPNLLITTVANTTSRGIPQVCDHMRIEALEATRSNFGVSLLANTASMAEAVQVA